METSLVKEKLCIFISLALVVMNAAAEQQYFRVDENRNWTEARMYCQVCYKDLVTVTATNSHVIAQMISCNHWIGLRKIFDSIRSDIQSACNSTFTDGFPYSSDNSTSSPLTDWMQWANGDPVSFQNWYPGWPAPKFPLPKIDCCSCSCTCPSSPEPTVKYSTESPFETTTSRNASSENSTGKNVQNMTFSDTTFSNTTFSDTTFSNTTFSDATFNNVTFSDTAFNNATFNTTFAPHTTYSLWTTTPRAPIESTCESRPVQPPVIPEPYKNYIEDSCVAMLSFGPWIEKHCFELLPFICYEDRFVGEVNVTRITSKSASLSWLSAPGNISHYRVEVKGDKELLTNLTVLTLDLTDLTPGTKYSVQVFPVKCERDLDPQNKVFYTIPPTVENLSVTSFTETSVTLSWNNSLGNNNFYQIGTDVGNPTKETWNKSMEFDGLSSGTCYNFTVITGVGDRSMWSEAASAAQCTKPGMVTNLKATNNSNTSVTLKWTPPAGHFTGFIVYTNSSTCIKDPMTVNTMEALVDNLSDGKKYNFSVQTVANFTLLGNNVTIETYTAPNQISNLRLSTTHTTLYACWEFKNDSDVHYRAELRLAAELIKKQDVSKPEVDFTDLKTAAEYNVTVYAVIEDIKSLPVSSTIFTLPSPPRAAKFNSSTTDSITFVWEPPENIFSSRYSVVLYSDFWHSNFASDTDINQTNYTFTGLKSGSMYNFEVRTNSGTNKSTPATASGWTESVRMTVGLSMLCSSQTPLLCDSSNTKDNVLVELKSFFQNMLNNTVICYVT